MGNSCLNVKVDKINKELSSKRRDLVAELENFSQLLQDEIITSEEFQRMKRHILMIGVELIKISGFPAQFGFLNGGYTHTFGEMCCGRPVFMSDSYENISLQYDGTMWRFSRQDYCFAFSTAQSKCPSEIHDDWTIPKGVCALKIQLAIKIRRLPIVSSVFVSNTSNFGDIDAHQSFIEVRAELNSATLPLILPYKVATEAELDVVWNSDSARTLTLGDKSTVTCGEASVLLRWRGSRFHTTVASILPENCVGTAVLGRWPMEGLGCWVDVVHCRAVAIPHMGRDCFAEVPEFSDDESQSDSESVEEKKYDERQALVIYEDDKS